MRNRFSFFMTVAIQGFRLRHVIFISPKAAPLKPYLFHSFYRAGLEQITYDFSPRRLTSNSRIRI